MTDDDSLAPIPVHRPHLPAAERLLPYLAEIDRTRRYSNFGPLARAFEARLAARLGLPEGGVACVANGTLGLTLALGALGARPGSLCMMPAWTFAATPAAAVAAGLRPWFVDVAEATWALDPDACRALLAGAPGPVGAAIAVGPFGAPLDAEAWDRFADGTGVPVVLDLAAGFDGARVGRAPAMVSLHATKALGVGEGGLVASGDGRLVEGVRRLSNFGFAERSEAVHLGTNAKLSEYAAAVGLAALDAWPERRAELAALTGAYAGALGGIPGVRLGPGFGAGWVGSTCNVVVERATAEAVAGALAAEGIETRRWWRDGAHAQPAFRRFPRAPLPVTERLAARVLGLPFYPGFAAVDRVCNGLERALAAAARRRALVG